MMIMRRIEWINAAKGIGILLIMLSHCRNFDGLLYFISEYISLYFILSGILSILIVVLFFCANA